ncbi:hypothetical protein ACOVJL_02030 [Scardovia wiggsiae]|uniref:hypothetical protein n=1 Tax=Scardovia wiggsiae TaxID=230143 RepID=UPI00374E5229
MGAKVLECLLQLIPSGTPWYVIVLVIVIVISLFIFVVKNFKSIKLLFVMKDYSKFGIIEKDNDNIEMLERIERRINSSNGVEKELLEEQKIKILGYDLLGYSKKSYYRAIRKKNTRYQPWLGYAFWYFSGILSSLGLCLISFIWCLTDNRIMKRIILNKINFSLLCILVVSILVSIMAWVSVYLYRWCFWHRSFRTDIQKPYLYREHYYEEVLGRCRENSFENSFKLIKLRETQRKGWKFGFFLLGIANSIGVLCTESLPHTWSTLSFVFLTVSVFILLWCFAFCPKMGKLPKIKTVESENKEWCEDKGKKEYFYKLVEHIAQSRDSVLYIGSANVKNNVPLHYIDLVSTGCKYMNKEDFENEKKDLKESSYGTIIMDFSTWTTDERDISSGVLEELKEKEIVSFLKPDGELFIGTKEINKAKSREELINIENKLESVEFFNIDYIQKHPNLSLVPILGLLSPTEYLVFGYRKTKTD